MNEIKKYVTKKELKSYFKKLYPICRSITGDGFRKSLGYNWKDC